jgi:hypothetical protein
MPNHCTNLLSCTSGKTIGSIIKPYLTDDGKCIDFNKIIPMPPEILESSNYSDMSYITAKRTPEEEEVDKIKLNELSEICLEKYGYKNWYDWSVAVWDTKWNAYSCYTFEDKSVFEIINEIDKIDDIGFQTAWSPPINVIRELAKLVGEPLRMSYYDEGWMFGGVYQVLADGSETDECYDDPEDCPEELREELDVDFYLECREDDEEDE